MNIKGERTDQGPLESEKSAYLISALQDGFETAAGETQDIY